MDDRRREREEHSFLTKSREMTLYGVSTMIFNYIIQSIAPFVPIEWREINTHIFAQNNPWTFLGLNADQCVFLGFFIFSILVCGIYVILVEVNFEKDNKSNDYHKEFKKFIN
jgi:ABC-type multidrug transport system permease subunit